MLALVVSNLLYPVVAVGVAALLCLVIVLRHRRPKSVEANMRAFHKGLRALAPEGDTPAHGATRTAQRRAAPRRTAAPLPVDQRRMEPRRVDERRVDQRRVDQRRAEQRKVPTSSPLPGNAPGNSGGSDPLDGVEAETG